MCSHRNNDWMRAKRYISLSAFVVVQAICTFDPEYLGENMYDGGNAYFRKIFYGHNASENVGKFCCKNIWCLNWCEVLCKFSKDFSIRKWFMFHQRLIISWTVGIFLYSRTILPKFLLKSLFPITPNSH